MNFIINEKKSKTHTGFTAPLTTSLLNSYCVFLISASLISASSMMAFKKKKRKKEKKKKVLNIND